MEILDKEEQEIIEELENDEWIPLSEKEEDELLYRINNKGKKNNKTQRINLRLLPEDIVMAKEKAKAEGMPYQTLIASIIHKYLTGQLLDKYTVETIIKKESKE